MCSVTGCDRPARKRGMCSAHYNRWWKYGNSGGSTIRKKADKGEPLRYLLKHMYDGCCYPWPYAKSSGGYPDIRDEGGHQFSGHRYVCEMVNGPSPEEGMVVRHLCGKGHLGCFNANCLEWGWSVDNNQDAIEHGTWAHGEQHGNMVLPTKDMERLRRMYDAGGYRQKDLAEIFGICLSQVNAIINLKSRRNG